MQKSVKNALIFTGIATAAIAIFASGTSKLFKFKRLVSFNMTGIKKFDIVGINLLQLPPDLGALRFIFDIAVDNAVDEEFRLTVPYIRAYGWNTDWKFYTETHKIM